MVLSIVTTNQGRVAQLVERSLSIGLPLRKVLGSIPSSSTTFAPGPLPREHSLFELHLSTSCTLLISAIISSVPIVEAQRGTWRVGSAPLRTVLATARGHPVTQSRCGRPRQRKWERLVGQWGYPPNQNRGTRPWREDAPGCEAALFRVTSGAFRCL